MALEENIKNSAENVKEENKTIEEGLEEVNPELKDVEIPEVNFDTEDIEVFVESRDEIMKKRANKILEGEIKDFKIGKLKDLKKKLNENEKDEADKYYIQIWVKTLNAPEKCGTENWSFPDYSKIEGLIRYGKLNNNTKLYKVIRRYIGTGKISLKQLRGVRVQIKTNEKGYASILV